jgi:hypothetical protein
VKYQTITRNTLVIPEHKHWGPQTLGPGSIVGILEEANPSPLGIKERLIKYVDVAGRETLGWITPHALLAEPLVKTLHMATLDGQEGTSPIDWLRNRVMLERQRDHSSDWTLITWVSTFGVQHITELRSAIRELGGIVQAKAEADNIISRALRLITKEEVKMSTEAVQETRQAATTKVKAAKKSTAKKAAAKRESAEGGRSMARTAGNTIVPLLSKASGAEAKKGLSIAKQLQAGKEVGKKQLTELRDAMNAVATEARTNKKESLASSLSSANRIVRRLARGK